MSNPRLRQNIVALGVLHIINVALTFVTMPYLLRVLGAEEWGRIVFVQMILNYLSWITNWGFYQSAVRKISANRESSTSINSIYMSTWAAQWILLGVSLILLLALVQWLPRFSSDVSLYLSGIGLVVANVLTPLWFLNGLEHIRESAFIQIAQKVLAIPLIFVFVESAEDASTYIAINAICALFVGFISLLWIKQKFALSFSRPKIKCIRNELAEGSSLFLSSVWGNLNATLIPMVLGLVAGNTALGFYNVADRVRGATIAILHPITHALFPRMCNLYATNRDNAVRMLKQSWIIISLLSISLSIVSLLFAEQILSVLGGADFMHSTKILQWFSLSIFVTTLSEYFIYQIIIPAQKYIFFQISIFATLALNAVFVYPFVFLFGAEGAAVLLLISESFLTTILLVAIVKNRFYLNIS
jgi:O-antigen/teichoic acid export membrane protein